MVEIGLEGAAWRVTSAALRSGEAAPPGRGPMISKNGLTEAIVFGGLGVMALSRLLAASASASTLGHVAALLAIAFLGYQGASQGRFSRSWGILAYVAGWFWMPIVPLVALWGMSVMWGKPNPGGAPRGLSRLTKHESAEPAVALRSSETPTAVSLADREQHRSDGASLSPELVHFQQSFFTLKVAAEHQGKVKALHAPFTSVYGDGVVPLLLADAGREWGIYVEPGKWDWPAKERCFRWLGLLRTSDREDLDVEVRSEEAVPEMVSAFTGSAPRVVFELVACLQYRWVPVADFGKQNALTLRRLASEYLAIDVGEGDAGLEALDRLVVGVLRPMGQILPPTVILLGSLFGETLIGRHGGRWLIRGDDIDDVAVELVSPSGVVEANVFNRIIKLFNNGVEDSTVWMARSIADRLAGS